MIIELLTSQWMIAVIGIIIAILITIQFLPDEFKPNKKLIINYFFDVFLIGLVFARIGFVIKHFTVFVQHPLDMIKINDGGFVTIFGIIAAIIFTLFKFKQNPQWIKPISMGTTSALGIMGLLFFFFFWMKSQEVYLPNKKFTTINNQTIYFNLLKGKPAVINIWATWCPPCRKEMPVFLEAQKNNPNIQFIFANQGESFDEINIFLLQNNLQLQNVVLDSHKDIAMLFNVRVFPTTLFFDSKGKLMDKHIGELSAAGMVEKVNSLQ